MSTLHYRVRQNCGGVAALLFLMFCLVGCSGSKQKTATLSGKVVYKDQPVTGGTIALYPSDGKEPNRTTITPDGTYTVAGAPLGESKVVIETDSVRGQTGQAYQAPPGQKAPDMGVKLPKHVEIPRIYADAKTTPLRVTVEGGSKTQDFTLTDAGK